MQNFAALQLSTLTADEVAALQAYKVAKDDPNSGASLCFDLNTALRNGLWAQDLPLELRRMTDALDAVFARTPRLQEELTVYRGVGTRLHLPVTQVGARFRSLEFWSTATHELSVENFLKPVHKPAYGAVLHLTVAAGFPAYNMETLRGAGGSEAEILLPRSVIWKVKAFGLLPEGRISGLVRGWFDNIALVELAAEPWAPPVA